MLRHNRHVFMIFLFSLITLGIVLPSSQAQDKNQTYQTITLENSAQLEELYRFECDGDTYHAASSFVGTTFAYACFVRNGSEYKAPIITAYSLDEDRQLWRFTAPSPMRQFDLLTDESIFVNAQSRLYIFVNGGQEEAHAEIFDFVIPVAISPDHHYVAVAQNDPETETGAVRLFTLPDFSPVDQEFSAPYQAGIQLALTNAEQGLVAIADSTEAIRVYEIETGELVMSAESTPLSSEYPNDVYDGVIFSPDASQLLVSECTVIQMGCWQEGITRFDIASGEITASRTFEYEYLDFFTFSPDSPLLLVSTCNKIHFLDIETLTETAISINAEGLCYLSEGIAFNDDGRLFAAYVYTEERASYVIYGVPVE